MPDSLSEQVSKQFSERRAHIHTSRLVPWPLPISAHRQETRPISVKVEFDKTWARRELGACSPSLYTVAGKERPIFFQSNGRQRGKNTNHHSVSAGITLWETAHTYSVPHFGRQNTG